MRAAFLGMLLFAATASAQLQLFAVQNGQDVAVGATYDFGKSAVGATKQVVFHVLNSGTATASLTTLQVSGAGFSLTGAPPLPIVILPGAKQTLTVSFSAGQVANYSANFQVNSISVLLLGSGVATATLSSGVGCTGPDPSGGTIDFGNVQVGLGTNCTYSLRNLNMVAVTVTSMVVTGQGFTGPQGVKTPLTLQPGEMVNFTLSFAPPAPGVFAGMLTIDTRSYVLSGTGLAQLSTPQLDVQSSAVHSGQQRSLTATLPNPAPVAVSGGITMSFIPDSPLIADDPLVKFVASGSRTVAFTAKAGDTQLTFGGQSSAVFQTGASSGKIKFSVTANLPVQGDPTKIVTVPPDVVQIDTASGLKMAGGLQISLTGLDNTLAAGAMSFTFYDTGGNTLSQGALKADFSSAFQSYFAKSAVAGMFQAMITFVVSGDVSKLGSVDVSITNPAGQASTARLQLP